MNAVVRSACFFNHTERGSAEMVSRKAGCPEGVMKMGAL